MSTGEQTCSRCGDQVHTLSTRGWCDGCESEGPDALDNFNDRYAAWEAAGKPAHEFRPLVPSATACWTCGYQEGAQHHPAGRRARNAVLVRDLASDVTRQAVQHGEDPVAALVTQLAIPASQGTVMLSTDQLARLVVAAGPMVERARSHLADREGYVDALERARTCLGCQRCQATGLDRCRTRTGGYARRDHARRVRW